MQRGQNRWSIFSLTLVLIAITAAYFSDASVPIIWITIGNLGKYPLLIPLVLIIVYASAIIVEGKNEGVSTKPQSWTSLTARLLLACFISLTLEVASGLLTFFLAFMFGGF